MKKIKALSLFANVGIAETYLSDIGIDVKIANEIDLKRARLYEYLYPETNMICGDITNHNIKDDIIKSSKQQKIDLIIATPPCQGMSTAGKNQKGDIRNTLICHAVDVILAVLPKYVFLENVPEQLTTKIIYDNKEMLIPDYLKLVLDAHYVFNDEFKINAKDYGVPQLRERAIILLTRKDVEKKWNFPQKEQKCITMKEAIGYLPSLDPFIVDVSREEHLKMFPNYYEREKKALEISKWFSPPKHVCRQVYAMMHTPSGQTAFDNIDEFKPHKKDGTKTKGFKNTYKRQEWDRPAFTVTMYNRTIGSQNNVHPGRFMYKDEDGHAVYSDPRVLTVYELMIISTLPKNWNLPNWVSEHFIRQVIGEGIPPLLVKKIMKELVNYDDE